MRNPEMYFEVSNPFRRALKLALFYYRNDHIRVEQWSRWRERDRYIFYPALYDQHERFARVWNRNLHLQGFLRPMSGIASCVDVSPERAKRLSPAPLLLHYHLAK